MKIKIGNKVYDSNTQPVMIILTDKDKDNISNMADWATKYCEYPDDMSIEEVKKWMEDC